MMDTRGVYSICAVVVPVALGLGLLYLTIIGGMDVWAVVVSLLGVVLLIPLVAILADLVREGAHPRNAKRRRKPVVEGQSQEESQGRGAREVV